MNKYFNSGIGRLRLIAFLEGSSLLILLFIAMPVKYLLGNPILVKTVGQAHGILFLLLVVYAIVVGAEKQWKFTSITLKVLISSVLPFGTFYIDHKILKGIHQNEEVQ